MSETLSSSRLLSGYHDLTLNSVAYDRTKLLLNLRFCSDTRDKMIELRECGFFRVNDFVPDSIVSRIRIFAGRDIDLGFVEDRVRWVTSLSDASCYLTMDALNRVVDELHAGKLSMLIVEPSWGAELVAIGERIAES